MPTRHELTRRKELIKFVENILAEQKEIYVPELIYKCTKKFGVHPYNVNEVITILTEANMAWLKEVATVNSKTVYNLVRSFHDESIAKLEANSILKAKPLEVVEDVL